MFTSDIVVSLKVLCEFTEVKKTPACCNFPKLRYCCQYHLHLVNWLPTLCSFTALALSLLHRDLQLFKHTHEASKKRIQEITSCFSWALVINNYFLTMTLKRCQLNTFESQRLVYTPTMFKKHNHFILALQFPEKSRRNWRHYPDVKLIR